MLSVSVNLNPYRKCFLFDLFPHLKLTNRVFLRLLCQEAAAQSFSLHQQPTLWLVDIPSSVFAELFFPVNPPSSSGSASNNCLIATKTELPAHGVQRQIKTADKSPASEFYQLTKQNKVKLICNECRSVCGNFAWISRIIYRAHNYCSITTTTDRNTHIYRKIQNTQKVQVDC